MSERRPSFIDALKEADAALADARPSPALDARFARSVRKRGPSLPVLAGAIAAAGIGVILVRAGSQAAAPVPAAIASGITFVPESCAPPELRAQLQVEPGCTLTVSEPELVMQTLEPSALLNTEDGIRIVRGRVSFQVANVRRPVSVLVSGGRIEVIGTRFTVTERGRGGRVTLEEGHLDFLRRDGGRSRLRPGETLEWGASPPIPSPPPEDPSGATAELTRSKHSATTSPPKGLRAERRPPSSVPAPLRSRFDSDGRSRRGVGRSAPERGLAR